MPSFQGETPANIIRRMTIDNSNNIKQLPTINTLAVMPGLTRHLFLTFPQEWFQASPHERRVPL
jgi:hypothetical protein